MYDGKGLAGIETFFYVLFIGFVLFFFDSIFFAYKYFTEDKKIVSKTIVTPVIKINVHDNKVDTTYVYKLK